MYLYDDRDSSCHILYTTPGVLPPSSFAYALPFLLPLPCVAEIMACSYSQICARRVCCCYNCPCNEEPSVDEDSGINITGYATGVCMQRTVQVCWKTSSSYLYKVAISPGCELLYYMYALTMCKGGSCIRLYGHCGRGYHSFKRIRASGLEQACQHSRQPELK